jgi:uncharacterized surface protein with fasciclin (FAS1) repeats
MKKILALLMVAANVAAAPVLVLAECNPMVGGAAMLPAKNIVDNAVNSPDHTMLVAAVQAAALVDTLKGNGPFTVFAPTNSGFAALPAGTVDSLLKPEAKPALTKVLTYHVIPGKLDAAALRKQIQAGNGTAQLKTASGGSLTAMMNGLMNIVLRDERGNVASISTYDVYQANGIIHVIEQGALAQLRRAEGAVEAPSGPARRHPSSGTRTGSSDGEFPSGYHLPHVKSPWSRSQAVSGIAIMRAYRPSPQTRDRQTQTSRSATGGDRSRPAARRALPRA